MNFVFPNTDMEKDFYTKLHPETQQVVLEVQENLGRSIRLTEVCRSDDDSERIYTQVANRLLKAGPLALHGLDLEQWSQIKDLSPTGLKNWCRWRSSWHKPWTAVDIGLADWNTPEVLSLHLWLQKRCPKPMWEVIDEPHGTGPHLHIARRDYGWLKEFPGSLRRAEGRKNPGA